MLDHAGEVVEVSVGFWRFVLSRAYRTRKLAEWREANRTPGGRFATAGEIVVSVIIGVGVPIVVASFIRGLLAP